MDAILEKGKATDQIQVPFMDDDGYEHVLYAHVAISFQKGTYALSIRPIPDHALKSPQLANALKAAIEKAIEHGDETIREMWGQKNQGALFDFDGNAKSEYAAVGSETPFAEAA